MNLTRAHRLVLKAVNREGGTAYLSALPGRTGLKQSTVKAVSDELVEEGYATRREGRLTLTGEGRQAAGTP